MTNETITVEATVNAPMEKVWDAWTQPEHIMNWCFASDDWEAPSATNELRTGGTFTTRMQAKDNGVGFDFGGTYSDVKEHELIEYDMNGDSRHVKITFTLVEGCIRVTETFDMEHENSRELQQGGWQSILNNFKKYAETL